MDQQQMNQQQTSNNIQQPTNNIYDELEIYDINDEKQLKEHNVNKDKASIQPAGCESKIDDAILKLLEQYKDKIPDDVVAELQYNTTAKTFASPKDIGCRDTIDNLTNKLNHNDTDITIRKVKARPKKTNPESIKIAMADAFGVGNLVHIPLTHSGFWVTLKPLTNEEKVTLYLELAKELDRLGKKTHDLIYTHTTALFTRIIKEYLSNKIVRTTLKLDKEQDIFDYILLPDINLLMWGILKSLYPKGYNFTLECKNALKIDPQTKKPLCTWKGISIVADLNKMLWIDEKQLNEKQLEIISRRVDNSVTIEEMQEYQDNLDTSGSNVISERTTDEEGNPITLDIYLKTPSINEFINKAEYNINNIENELTKLVNDNTIKDTPDDKTKAELELSKAIELQFYNHYVKSINFNGEIYNTPDAINAALEVLTDTVEIREKIKSRIIDYINKSLVAFIGMPEFTCPVCKSKQTDNKTGFIAFDVFMHFFILLAFRYQTIIENS